MTEAPLRLERRLLVAWILVCAVTPLFPVLGWTAANKTVLPGAAHAEVLGPALLVLALAAWAAPLVLWTWVLKRIAPRLAPWAIALALLAAGVAMLPLETMGHGLREVRLAFLPGLQSLRADFEWSVLADLPWARLLAHSAAIAAATLCIPALVFARAAGVRWFAPLVAVMAASMATAVAEQAWQLNGDWMRHLIEYSLNGWAWWQRAEALCLRGGQGALWGLASAWVFLALANGRGTAPRTAGSTAPGPAMLAGFAALLLLPPSAAYLANPFHARHAWDVARNAASRAPATDVSEGEPLLRFVAASAPALRNLPWRASFSPDAATVLAVDADRRIVRIDTATGAILGTLGERLALYENPDWAWSADGRWLALRTWGAETKAGIYSHHQARLRLYELPAYRLVADYRADGAPCIEHQDMRPQFEAGGQAVWIACGTHTEPKPESLLALRLSVPALQPDGERRYGELAPLPMRRLASVRGAIWSWHHGYGREAQLRLRDLSADREAVRLAPNPATGHGDEMTLQEAVLTDTTLSFRYAAGPERRMQTFVHDSRSGTLLRVVDHGVPGRGTPYASSLETRQGLHIESRWRPETKAGEISVVDAETVPRQRLHSVAQRLLAVSADGRWLATQALADGRLRIYRIGP